MKKYIILIPLYNDWKSVSKLLREIDLQIDNWDVATSVFIINDKLFTKEDLEKPY